MNDIELRLYLNIAKHCLNKNMATNKNATIRYQTLNKCFRNPGRRYFIDCLVDECNEALRDVDPNTSGVKKRQVYEDIKFMKDSRGFEAPIEATREGRKTFYQYSDMDFSINNQPLNEKEAQQLKEFLITLSRFKGLPQFEWIEELGARLENSFNLKSNNRVISFDENEFLTGRHRISTLYEAIISRKVLKICYMPYFQDEDTFDFHPYHLKQYNKRWFVFGIKNGSEFITNLALDRIKSIENSATEFIPNVNFDFEEFFEDIIGVTIPNDQELEKVILKIDASLWPYIETKPLHGSQKIIQREEGYIQIQLEVFINYELQALILSRGEQIEVMEPEGLRNLIQKRVEELNRKYLQ